MIGSRRPAKSRSRTKPRRRARRNPLTGAAIVKLALDHVGERYEQRARAPLTNADFKGPWDCAEFVSWCVYQATGILYGAKPAHDPAKAEAYTGYWAEHAERDGTTIPIEDALAIEGACLLRKPSGKLGGHIALSTGDGRTIEAHSTKRGVVRHTATGRAWHYGVLVPGVEYFRSESRVRYRAPQSILRVTQPLTRGPSTERLQAALKKRGFDPGPLDGIYGPRTTAAVVAFQVKHGLVPDGETGKETLKALTLTARTADSRGRRTPSAPRRP